ncbi:MAG: hypothetical protein ONB46_06595 [candidate division KSB1 bacterium]|nr:hypothetical protein [candidate division KSB1 bacterium]MDZ7367229.1 hypothetical protein [candidate division KSB1 bacterium]MDZ7405288.1 hypothetical protein [candidate division KSB1 bacterium]
MNAATAAKGIVTNVLAAMAHATVRIARAPRGVLTAEFQSLSLKMPVTDFHETARRQARNATWLAMLLIGVYGNDAEGMCINSSTTDGTNFHGLTILRKSV